MKDILIVIILVIVIFAGTDIIIMVDEILQKIMNWLEGRK